MIEIRFYDDNGLDPVPNYSRCRNRESVNSLDKKLCVCLQRHPSPPAWWEVVSMFSFSRRIAFRNQQAVNGRKEEDTKSSKHNHFPLLRHLKTFPGCAMNVVECCKKELGGF